MLVEVDPNQTLDASPGQGVGVFTEYRAGGHWRVWWMCDTARSGMPCGFDVTASVPAGEITNVAGESLGPSDQVDLPSAFQVHAVTRTSTAIAAVTFDTAPGATISLDAQIDGQRSGAVLFFVQDGKVNGGYTGALTDPLDLEPKAP
jgi:hypothetical protein